jgi:hypothetical protein
MLRLAAGAGGELAIGAGRPATDRSDPIRSAGPAAQGALPQPAHSMFAGAPQSAAAATTAAFTTVADCWPSFRAGPSERSPHDPDGGRLNTHTPERPPTTLNVFIGLLRRPARRILFATWRKWAHRLHESRRARLEAGRRPAAGAT